MVSAMGLLDDAIREHLELKRRRGADPTEVARQQQEALAPVGAGEGAWEHEHPAQQDDVSHAAGDEHPTASHEQLPVADEEGAHGVQETAEIDMQTVLDEPAAGDVGASEPHLGSAAERDAATALDWGAPLSADEVPREIPGQERMPFDDDSPDEAEGSG
jgi:hypothetical protein